jgi:cytochrome c biogenesis protein CcmG/thiol:disulfide interchange protein DsbE
VAPRFLAWSGRRVILAVLVVVAVVIPAGSALLGRHRDRASGQPVASTAVVPVAGTRSYPPGTPAPALRLEGLDGGTVDLAAFRGRPVVVNFWATWCPPCVREFPLLAKAAATHRADHLAVVGVLSRDNPEAARDFVRAHHATWPIALDPTGQTGATWGVAVGLPHTFFLRPDGTLAAHHLGELTQATLDRQLAQILH